jgi:4a-hydroxytetrahydrobiopterin dehydratase
MAGESERELSRQELSDAVFAAGWRYVLAVFVTSVRVDSLPRSAALAAKIGEAIGADADEHVRFDVRPDRLVIAVQTRRSARLTPRDIELARRISDLVASEGLKTTPDVGGSDRSVQLVEIGIDALDIPKIRPFWKAVMGYGDEAHRTGPEDALIDPQWQAPAIWFQQMDAPRPQRNRIHFDISVPHDEAERRVAAAIAAGGTLVSDRRAPAFWVLADPEGNEACVTTWQGRD